MPSLTDARLRAEIGRCQSCEAKPCRSGCPANLSPADFILAARCGEPSDYRRAAALILAQNPLGGTCGQVCPDTLCMARCTRRSFDGPVEIPAIQAAIVERARGLGVLPRFAPLPSTGQRVAVIGAGPAGLGAASVLARAGHAVHVFDRAQQPGGMARLIPGHRLDPEVLAGDLEWLAGPGTLQFVLGDAVPLPRDLLGRGFAAVVVAGGLGEPVPLDVPGAERALHWTDVLGPNPPSLRGRRVAVVGDGAVALDCAGAALAQGAAHVELFALRALPELGLTGRERERLLASGVHASFRVRVTAILTRGRGGAARVAGLALRDVSLPEGQAFHPTRLVDLQHGERERRDLDAVILAIGGRAGLRREPHPRIVYAGDLESGPTTVVEALASGKRAGLEVHKLLAGGEEATCPDRPSCPEGGGACPRRATCPEWNRPPSQGGGSAAPRPTAGLPVPLDTEAFGQRLASPFLLAAGPFTDGYGPVRRAYEAGWAGAVMAAPASGAGSVEALDRLCRDVERLRREFPERLTLVAAGAPAEGAPGMDAGARPEALRRLEAAGAVVVHPHVVPCAAGGPTDYREAATLLTLGARTVQVGALVERHGLGILGELQAGLSYHLAERGLGSVSDLAGRTPARVPPPAGPAPAKAEVQASLCNGCGNCTRCPYEAVTLDARRIAAVDADRCTGCALCLAQCLPGALSLRATA